MGVILDSSILIAAERGRFDLTRFLSVHPAELFFITVITASELFHGCARAIQPELLERCRSFVEGVLGNYFSLPFTLREARAHALIWAELESKRTPVGKRDMLIAAIARANNHSLATLNINEFSLVAGLPSVNVLPFALPEK